MQPRFHWRFWAPIECVGGKVYFGTYWFDVNGIAPSQTHEQWYIKARMGMWDED